MGSWGWKGPYDRILELPNARGSALPSSGRAGLRYRDDLGEIQQSSGGLDWAPLSSGNATALAQRDWYINATSGDDGNDGKTTATALRTIGEYTKRLGNGVVTAGVPSNVYLSGDFAETEYVFQAHYPDGVTFYGERTVIGTGSVTAFQAWDDTAETDGQITDSAIPTSWTASGYVGNMIVLTSGPNSGAVAWIAKDLDAKTARHSPFAKLWIQTRLDPAIGNTYEVVTLNKISGRFFFLGTTGDWGFTLQDLNVELDPGDDFVPLTNAIQGWLYFVACSVTAVGTSSAYVVHRGHVWDVISSKWAVGGRRIDVVGNYFGVLYSLFASFIWGQDGATVELDEVLFQSDAFGESVSARVKLSRFAQLFCYKGVLGFYDDNDASSRCLDVQAGCMVQALTNAKFFGTGNAGYGLWLASGSSAVWPSGDTCADHYHITTSGTEVRYGGTNTTYAAIGGAGVVNAANNAMAVPTES